MSEEIKQAQEHAGRAGRQARHAAKNAAKATQMAAAPVVGQAEQVAENAADAVKQVDVRAISRGLSTTGQGFMALSIAATAATFAFARFRKARNESYIVEVGS